MRSRWQSSGRSRSQTRAPAGASPAPARRPSAAIVPGRTSRLHVPQLAQLAENLRHALFYRFAAGVDRDIGALRLLVGIGYPREILDLSGERLLVQALDVALGQDIDRAFDEDLEEAGAAVLDPA